MTLISEQAVVDTSARIGSNVKIGPFCVVGPDVEIGDDCELISHVTIDGTTRIGRRNIFYQNVVIGVAPQDLKYRGGATVTVIGDDNVIREHVTVHRGTELGGGKTVIGNNNLFMVGCHIAHDCIVENNIVMANQAMLAGHVKIENYAVVMALVGIHHFVTVGQYSYIGGMTPVRRDVPPYMKFSGDPNEVRGVNEEGLKRHNFSDELIGRLKQMYRKLFRESNSISERLEELESTQDMNEHIKYLCDFMRNSCKGRFGRYLELSRQDSVEDRKNRTPLEIRTKK
jgi:UDP-N-acetylglucosamine acyltransferase